MLSIPLAVAACGLRSSGNEETVAAPAEALTAASPAGELLPTGARITPTAAPGASFSGLNPGLAALPGFLADHAVTTVVSPDGRTLLVLTSGYNAITTPDGTGNFVPELSNEYVFVYDISGGAPVKVQVLQVPNTFVGMAFHPSGAEFYVSGGVNDNVHVYRAGSAGWTEALPPIALGHASGLGLGLAPAAAGLAVTGDGHKLVVANYENDSVSVVDLATRAVADIPLRPGKIDPAQSGQAGGEFPYWVAVKGSDKAYVSSQRDREVVVVDLGAGAVRGRIAVGAQPNKMILDRSQGRLFVANGASDSVSIVDTGTDGVIASFGTTAPTALLPNPRAFKGANPNSLALSPDERTLFVTNGGLNALAVIRLPMVDRGKHHGDDDDGRPAPEVVGLIPTGWYPESVSLSADGRRFFVVNGKANAGPACIDVAAGGSYVSCWIGNQYVWQLEKAGLLTAPVPVPATLARLSLQAAANNHFPSVAGSQQHEALMAFLRARIKHVIYVVKENRTYDQLLGDLPQGNGDPMLTIFPQANTPNHHALASQFVTLDAFQDSGETSGVGWNWTTAGRTTDSIEKTQPVNYAGRGLSYDWEGTNRNINVGLATTAERLAANPASPPDPDLLPGTADVAAGDPPDSEGAGANYLWDSALRRGLSIRNYGFFGDLTRYFLPASTGLNVPLERHPAAAGVRQFYPAKAALQTTSDLFYRGYDNAYPDYWRVQEWAREFDGYAASGDLPALETVRIMHDHFGSFGSAIDGVNTPPLQMADNDYALGLIIEKVAGSRFRDDTLIFVIEDDAQDGPDHVDAHRSVAYVVGPYVKQGAVVSAHYNTVSMVKTIEAVLGLEPLGLTDALAEPMAEVFDRHLSPDRFAYAAIVPEILRGSALPLPPATAANALPRATRMAADGIARPSHDARYWERVMRGQNFDREDALDTDRFNQALWRGIMGAVPYPAIRDGRDLSTDRLQLLRSLLGA